MFLGVFWIDFIVFFIVVVIVVIFYKYGINIEIVEDVVKVLELFVGKYVLSFFVIGFFGVLFLGVYILLFLIVYVIIEVFGFENGFDKKFKEVFVFYGIIFFFIVIGVGIILFLNILLIKFMIIV